ncbi:MAG: peptidoglycan editing factor PgeF, partial [Azonexus sp.]
MNESYAPDWSIPANVRALQTTRIGGVSGAPWDSFNLGDHVGDAPEAVAANRALLRRVLPGDPFWLTQVHGTVAVDLDKRPKISQGDAAYSRQPGNVCAVMTADCLPVLFCDRQGSVVAAAHAGWRGLLAGVLENAVSAMQVAPENILAWLGPAIGPACFEVGSEVRDAFVSDNAAASLAFVPSAGDGKWLCDIYLLARLRLLRMGITAVSGGEACT